jgi:hypothetical protein
VSLATKLLDPQKRVYTTFILFYCQVDIILYQGIVVSLAEMNRNLFLHLKLSAVCVNYIDLGSLALIYTCSVLVLPF